MPAVGRPRRRRESCGRRGRRTFQSRCCTHSRRSLRLSSLLSQVEAQAYSIEYCAALRLYEWLLTRCSVNAFIRELACHLYRRCDMFVGAEQPAQPVPESAPASPPAKKALPAALLARLKARGIAVAAGQEQRQQPADQPPMNGQAETPADATTEPSMPTVAENGSATAVAPVAGAYIHKTSSRRPVRSGDEPQRTHFHLTERAPPALRS